ncbi:MAG: DHH family phosphoesterase [Candidatus Kapaibacterium sp.]|nr:MAG: DHH family phosphoesterase [Candidatus Kapabacteria bacterium]
MQPEEFARYRDATRAIAAVLTSSNRIVLTTHVRPDGDALGSVLGLGNALSAMGKQPKLVIPSPLPVSLKFLPGSDAIEVYDSSRHDALIATADVIVCLDFNVLDRLDAMAPAVAASPAVRLLVDHHLEPAPGFHAMLWDTEVASTAELVFALLLLEFPGAFSAAVATPLYTGILTDTGNFRFPRTTARTHRIVAALIEYGADPVAIAEALYDQNSPARLRLLGEVLRQLELHCDGACVMLQLRRKDVLDAGAREDDTEGFVQYTLTVAGARVGIFISELHDGSDGVKVSLRSKGTFDVARIAEELGGGGHRNAAGAVVRGISLEAARQRVLAMIEAALQAE